MIFSITHAFCRGRVIILKEKIMKKNMKKILLLSALTISALSFGACKNANTDITDISTEAETERVVETKEVSKYSKLLEKEWKK